MFRKFGLPVLALAGVIFAVYSVVAGSRAVPPAQPVSAPATSPYDLTLAGAGLVEPASENIAVGALVPGVATRVHVRVGDVVQAGDPLFMVDDRDLQAQLLVQEASLDAARQELARLRALPRAEDLPPAEARVVEAAAQLADVRQQYQMWQSLPDKRAVSAEEMDRRRFAVDVAEARLREAQARLELLRAGAWDADLRVAEARVASAEAEIRKTRVLIERHTVRSPIDGQVLQVKLREGEYAPAGATSTPLMLLGDVRTLHVRVDVDENDAWRLRPGATARGFLRGNSDLSTALRFVRVEPYVVPKRSLTGESTERVDTRVLQVIYAFERGGLPVYVGQQMDVFIDAPSDAAVEQEPS